MISRNKYWTEQESQSPALLLCQKRHIRGKNKMNFKQEILKSIQIMIDKKIGDYKADRTYKSVIKRITKKGYVIIDETGSERTVPCAIPNVELRPMQSVWVKEPMGNVRNLHIVGVAENTGNSSRRR